MRVFISSPYEDLREHRAQIALQCASLPVRLSMMEAFDADGRAPRQYCEDRVREHDLFVLVLRARYGSRPENEHRSFTHLEYDAARAHGIETLVFLAHLDTVPASELAEDPGDWVRLSDFRRELMARHTCRSFRDPAQLGQLVAGAIGRRLAISEPVAEEADPDFPRPPKPYLAHPYLAPQVFVGRDRERAELDAWIGDPGRPGLVLTGIGGVGKSCLAWRWLSEKLAATSSWDGVIWWSFYESEARFDSFLRGAYGYLNGATSAQAAAIGRTDLWSSLVRAISHRRLLIVLDGFERELRGYARSDAARLSDDVEEGDAIFRQCVDPFVGRRLPLLADRASESKVLLTSRLVPNDLVLRTGQPVEGWTIAPLAGIDVAGAQALFHAMGLTGSTAEIEYICNRLGNHALSISLLAGTLSRDPLHDGSLSGIEKAFDRVESEVEGRARVLQHVAANLNDVHKGILCRIAAFRSSIHTRELLLVNELATRDVPEPPPFRGSVLELVERGLLQADRGTFDLHPVVRSYFYSKLQKPNVEDTHRILASHFEAAGTERRISRREDLGPTMEFFHHLVGAGEHERAFGVYDDRLHHRLYHDYADYHAGISLLDLLKPGTLESETRQARVHVWLGNNWGRLGSYERARFHLDEAARIYRESGHLREHARNLGDLAMLDLGEGELARGEQRLTEAERIQEELNDPFWLAVSRTYHGRLEKIVGNGAGARELLLSAQEYWNEKKMSRSQGVGLCDLAEVALGEGDPDEASRLVEASERTFRKRAYPLDRVHLCLVRASCGLARGELGSVEEDIDTAERLARDSCIHEVEPQVVLLRAEWHARLAARGDGGGHAARALELARNAGRIAAQMNLRLDEADAELAIARWSEDVGAARRAAELAACGEDPVRSRYVYRAVHGPASALVAALG